MSPLITSIGAMRIQIGVAISCAPTVRPGQRHRRGGHPLVTVHLLHRYRQHDGRQPIHSQAILRPRHARAGITPESSLRRLNNPVQSAAGNRILARNCRRSRRQAGSGGGAPVRATRRPAASVAGVVELPGRAGWLNRRRGRLGAARPVSPYVSRVSARPASPVQPAAVRARRGPAAAVGGEIGLPRRAGEACPGAGAPVRAGRRPAAPIGAEVRLACRAGPAGPGAGAAISAGGGSAAPVGVEVGLARRTGWPAGPGGGAPVGAGGGPTAPVDAEIRIARRASPRAGGCDASRAGDPHLPDRARPASSAGPLAVRAMTRRQHQHGPAHGPEARDFSYPRKLRGGGVGARLRASRPATALSLGGSALSVGLVAHDGSTSPTAHNPNARTHRIDQQPRRPRPSHEAELPRLDLFNHMSDTSRQLRRSTYRGHSIQLRPHLSKPVGACRRSGFLKPAGSHRSGMNSAPTMSP